MPTRGPVPKRSTERRRRNHEADATAVARTGVVRVPAASKEWHPVARRWYLSLKQSGQSDFFEPSDWAAAHYVAEAMTRNLNDRRFSGQLFSSVWAAMTDLLTTEAARRRSRMEVERGLVEQADDTAESVSEFLEALAKA